MSVADRSARLKTLPDALASCMLAMEQIRPGEAIASIVFGAPDEDEFQGFFWRMTLVQTRVIGQPNPGPYTDEEMSIRGNVSKEENYRKVIAAYTEAAGFYAIPKSGRH